VNESTRSDGERVTVVVPAYGPRPQLFATVAALQRQSPPVERIIVSHSGEGNPRPRLAALGVEVLHSDARLYAGAARNRGLGLAKTEWVAFVDEDVIVDDDWHAALQRAIARGEADCIAGSVGYAVSGGYWGLSLWYAEFSSVHPHLPPAPISSGATANLAVRREVVSSIGGFREDWLTGEDALAQAELEKREYKICFEPSVSGRHVNLPGLRHMIRHSYRLGQYSARVRRLHPHLTGASAVRWPVLSLGMWLARLNQIYVRTLMARKASMMSLIWHTPGILLSILAWNVGFSREVFGSRKSELDCKQQVT